MRVFPTEIIGILLHSGKYTPNQVRLAYNLKAI